MKPNNKFRHHHPLLIKVGMLLGYDTPEKQDQFMRGCEAYRYGE